MPLSQNSTDALCFETVRMRRVFETPNSLVSELPKPSVDRVSESFVFEMPIFKFPSLHHH